MTEKVMPLFYARYITRILSSRIRFKKFKNFKNDNNTLKVFKIQ